MGAAWAVAQPSAASLLLAASEVDFAAAWGTALGLPVHAHAPPARQQLGRSSAERHGSDTTGTGTGTGTARPPHPLSASALCLAGSEEDFQVRIM